MLKECWFSHLGFQGKIFVYCVCLSFIFLFICFFSFLVGLVWVFISLQQRKHIVIINDVSTFNSIIH
jgi:hypothetical protein